MRCVAIIARIWLRSPRAGFREFRVLFSPESEGLGSKMGFSSTIHTDTVENAHRFNPIGVI